MSKLKVLDPRAPTRSPTARVCKTIHEGRRVWCQEESWDVPAADGARLFVLRRTPDGESVSTPVLLIHGLAQNRLTWDLPQRSFQNHLVECGFDTFNVELRGHGRSREIGSPYPRSFEDYYRLDVPAVLDAVQRVTGGRKCLLVGHSLGGSVCYASGVRFPGRIAGIVSIGGPTHFGRGLSMNRYAGLAVTALYRHLPPWPWVLRKIPYAFGDLLGLFVTANAWYFDNPAQRFPLSVWLPGSMEPEVLRLRMRDGWDRTSIAVFMTMMRWFSSRAGNRSDDDRIDYSEELGGLGVPILFAVGNQDRVAPVESIRPGFDGCGSADKTLHLFGGSGVDFGHIDLICGLRAPSHTWPVITQWLKDHAGAAKPEALDQSAFSAA